MYTDTCPTPASSACGTTCDAPEFFTLGAKSGSTSIGNVTYNSGSGHLHLSTASNYEAIDFTLNKGVLEDYSDGTTIYLQTGSPSLMYDGSSDPSGYGTITCTMNCDSTLCCYNTYTGADTIALYCNADTDDHFYFATAAQVASDNCEALTLYVASD